MSRPLVVTLLPKRMAVAIDEAKFMPRREPGEPVYEEARKGLLDLGRMAEHDVSVIEAARLRLDCLDEDAGRRLNLVAGSLHSSQRPRPRVIQQCAPPSREKLVLPLDDFGLDPAAAHPRARKPWMSRAVAIPPAGLMGLRNRDDQEWPAVLLQRSPDDGLPVAKPRSMDERTPTPAAGAQVAINDLAAAGAELAVAW